MSKGEYHFFRLDFPLAAACCCLAILAGPVRAEDPAPSYATRYAAYMPNPGDWMSNRALAIDENGKQYLAYGVDHLYVASKEAGATTWTTELVDSSWRVGKFTAIALDCKGNPHVAYNDFSNNGDLKYARYDGRSWQIEVVDGGGEDGDWLGGHASIALDESGHPHISYLDASNNALKYATHDGKSWRVDEVGGVGSTSVSHDFVTSIALDSKGMPHISYFDNSTLDLMYASYGNGAWSIERVDGDGVDVGRYSSLAIDANDTPHISYYDRSLGALKYAYYDDSEAGAPSSNPEAKPSAPVGWVIDEVDGQDDIGHYSSLRLDSDGLPHIGYAYADGEGLKYAYWDTSLAGGATAPTGGALPAGDWNIQGIDGVGDRQSISIGVDQNGQTCFAAMDNDNGVRLLDIHIHQAISPELHPADNDNGVRLLDIHWDPSKIGTGTEQEPAGDWSTELIVQGGRTDGRNGLVLDADGYPHISYQASYRDTDGNDIKELRYTRWDGSAWQEEVVVGPPAELDTDFEPADFNDIALDSKGYPHIAYSFYDNDTWEYSLRHAFWNGSAWQTEILMENEDCGFVSIAVDSKDFVHVSFYAPYIEDGHLMYMRQSSFMGGLSWSNPVIVDDCNDKGYYECGKHSDMALDAGDMPRFSYNVEYYDGSLDYSYLRFARAQTTASGPAGGKLDPKAISLVTYANETLDDCDGSYYCGKSTAIAIDSAGDPHISYRDGAQDEDDTIRYIGGTNDGWTDPIILSTWAGDGETDIAVDGNNNPYVSYVWYDEEKDSRAFMFAHYDGVAWHSAIIEQNDYAGPIAKANAVAVDAKGNPHYIYTEKSTGDLKHYGPLATPAPLPPLPNLCAPAFPWPMFLPAITGAGK